MRVLLFIVATVYNICCRHVNVQEMTCHNKYQYAFCYVVGGTQEDMFVPKDNRILKKTSIISKVIRVIQLMIYEHKTVQLYQYLTNSESRMVPLGFQLH